MYRISWSLKGHLKKKLHNARERKQTTKKRVQTRVKSMKEGEEMVPEKGLRDKEIGHIHSKQLYFIGIDCIFFLEFRILSMNNV